MAKRCVAYAIRKKGTKHKWLQYYTGVGDWGGFGEWAILYDDADAAADAADTYGGEVVPVPEPEGDN